MKRFSLLYAAPLLLLLAGIALPLVRGTETLFLRDTFNAHLPMKASEAEALRRGTIPLIFEGSPSCSHSATLWPSATGSRTSTARPPALRTYPLGIGRAATAALLRRVRSA